MANTMDFRALVAGVALALVSVGGAVMAVGGAGPGGEPAGATSESLRSTKALEGFVGEWEIDAKWDDGRPLKARAIYSSEMGGKHIRTQTWLPKPDGTEYQRYQGMMTWHPRKNAFAVYSFAYDGAVTEALATTDDGKTLKIGFEPFEPGAPSPLRQTLRLVSADALEWTVEMNAGGEWKRLIQAEWKRKK